MTIAGKVYLVGAGPGDPGLITVRGLECLQQADVVVHDSLANEVLLRHAPDAEHIYVGKKADRHTLPQEDINRILVEQARRVACVVRLKGGDPFVFGRGGEEALALTEAGIPFEIVPGVTAAIAAPAYAGIPVTHRGLATSFSLITGHGDPARPDSRLDLSSLVTDGTLAFYMGVKNLPHIVAELVRLGRPEDTPVAVVEWGTYARQRTVTGTLASIHAACRRENIQPPALILVGDVVNLRESLSWFENRPLYGKRIAVTRTRTAKSALVQQLRELGAEVFEFPTIEIETATPSASGESLEGYDWIVLTSANAVASLFDSLADQGCDARSLAGVKLLGIASSTCEALRERFLQVDLAPEPYEVPAVLAELARREGNLAGKRFLMPRADLARSRLADALREAGAEVVERVAYRTAVPKSAEEHVQALLAFHPDLVSFTSSAAIRNFARILGPDRLAEVSTHANAAVMGPVSANAARAAGLNVVVEPAQHDIPSFVQAVVDWGRG